MQKEEMLGNLNMFDFLTYWGIKSQSTPYKDGALVLDHQGWPTTLGGSVYTYYIFIYFKYLNDQ